MQIVYIAIISLVTAVLASLLGRRSTPTLADVVISVTATVTTVGLAYIAQDSGVEWSDGISLFMAAALTLGFSALVHQPLRIK